MKSQFTITNFLWGVKKRFLLHKYTSCIIHEQIILPSTACTVPPILQSCTKLVGTHALLIIITFIIKMYVYKMTCMIQYPCSKHASSPSLPHQAMLVYICFLFIRSALSLTTLILGSGEQSFYYSVPTVSYKIVVYTNQLSILSVFWPFTQWTTGGGHSNGKKGYQGSSMDTQKAP